MYISGLGFCVPMQHKENYKKLYAIAPIDQYILLSVHTAILSKRKKPT